MSTAQKIAVLGDDFVSVHKELQIVKAKKKTSCQPGWIVLSNMLSPVV